MMLNSKKRCCRRKHIALYYLYKIQKHAKLNVGDTEICEKNIRKNKEVINSTFGIMVGVKERRWNLGQAQFYFLS